jgi:hypothetical protein
VNRRPVVRSDLVRTDNPEKTVWTMRPKTAQGMLKTVKVKSADRMVTVRDGWKGWDRAMTNKLEPSRYIRAAGGIVWRSLAVGAGYVLLSMIGGAAAEALRLPAFSIGSPADLGIYLAIAFVSGVLFGLTLGPVASRLPLRFFERTGVLFATLFFFNQLTNVIEAVFFMTIPAVEWIFSLFVSAIEHAGLAVLLASLYRPQSGRRSLWTFLKEILRRRGWLDWLGRFVVSAIMFVGVYFVFGMVVAPIVVPFYQNPALGLRLTIPGIDVLLPLEVGRGLLHALMLFPLVSLLRSEETRSRWGIAFWIILVLVVLGSWNPMLNATFWPLELRLAHGLELMADGMVYGLLFVWLMAPGRARPDSVRKDYPAPA